MATEKKILNDKDYKAIMSQIDRLMAKGSDKITKRELAEIQKLSLAAQQYEQRKYEIDPPNRKSKCQMRPKILTGKCHKIIYANLNELQVNAAFLLNVI